MDEVKNIFDEKSFCESFDENSFDEIFFASNVNEIISYYHANKNILEIPNRIHCEFEIGEAITYFTINLVNNSGQLGFQTPDQSLYDHLFFDAYLNPWRMQDCLEKIGFERTKEMFAKLKEIKIPKYYVPSYFLDENYAKINKKI